VGSTRGSVDMKCPKCLEGRLVRWCKHRGAFNSPRQPTYVCVLCVCPF